MPRLKRRTKLNRRYCLHTKLDRRICPTCGGEVTKWNHRDKIQRCYGCRKCFVWDSAKTVPARRTRGRPTLRRSGRGSPAMSTIDECSESGDDSSRPSSGSIRMDDARMPDQEVLRWLISTTPQEGGHSIDDNGDGAGDHEDAPVIDDAFVDRGPARDIGSLPPEDERLTLHVWEIGNKNNTAPLCTTAVPMIGLNQQNTTASSPATAVPELIADAPSPTFPHPTPPCTTSPSPSSPRPSLPSPTTKKKKKRCRLRGRLREQLREGFRREPPEPREPRPSLEDLISIPEAVPRQRATELLNTLILARYIHGRGASAEPITASSAIVPQEPDGRLQQHAANLHDTLARLEALRVDSSDELPTSSRRKSFWSRLACFL